MATSKTAQKTTSKANPFTALRREAIEHEKAGRWAQAAESWTRASEVAGSASPNDVFARLVWVEYQMDAAKRAKAARAQAEHTC